MRFWATELVTLSNETRLARFPDISRQVEWAASNATLNYYAAVYGVAAEGTEQALTASTELDGLLFGEGSCLSKARGPARAAVALPCATPSPSHSQVVYAREVSPR